MKCVSCDNEVSCSYCRGRPICETCSQELGSLIALTNSVGLENHAFQQAEAASNSSKLAKLMKWITYMKEAGEKLDKKTSFLSGFLSAFKNDLHTDIVLKAGDDGRVVPAHRALLASRSKIFKDILDPETCKCSPGDTITLPDLTPEELECLLEFLYSGNLSEEQLKRHAYSLLIAADKYEISHLREVCESYMLSTLNLLNVLDVLSLADMCSNELLKDKALDFIARNADDVVFWVKYEEFAPKYPHLCVQISRAFRDANKRGP